MGVALGQRSDGVRGRVSCVEDELEARLGERVLEAVVPFGDQQVPGRDPAQVPKRGELPLAGDLVERDRGVGGVEPRAAGDLA